MKPVVNKTFIPGVPGYDKVEFPFEAPPGSEVTLSLYTVGGAEIKVVGGTVPDDGRIVLVWDGTDDYNGQVVESGIYVYQIGTGSKRFSGLVVIAK